MADEETESGGRTGSGPEASEGVEQTRKRDEGVDASPTPRHRREEGPSLGFSLPPISLPKVRLPERLSLLLPIPEPPAKDAPSVRLRTSSVLAAVALLDVLDAAVGVGFGFETLPWLRAVVGLAVSVVFAGPAGLLYGWELLATLAGFGWLALAPTATLLLVGRLLLAGGQN